MLRRSTERGGESGEAGGHRSRTSGSSAPKAHDPLNEGTRLTLGASSTHFRRWRGELNHPCRTAWR